ncbi:transporter substrate-binding domain-containing protein [uncultured Microbulbifer sp.]|uniref:transporter substrate-binding domain-containing protein n=1 Tax=uncultured Microbulbifer sp. TaxID=348147 RepID=UPI002635D6EC|nr:transporter substrate-binding domain-containing protein [uncultured Microbulbifer sp.]
MEHPFLTRLLRYLALIVLIALAAALSACHSDTAPAPENEQSGEAHPTESIPGGEKSKSAPNKSDTTGGKASTTRAADTNDLRPEASWPPETSGEYPINAYDNYIETGDLPSIRDHKKLRILVDISNSDSLHREATLQDVELSEAKKMAQRIGLEPVVLYADNFDQLLPLLKAGKGDIIANYMIVTDEREQEVAFSTPMAETQLVLVSRNDMKPALTSDSLKGKTLTVTKGTVFETRARKFVQKYPDLKLNVSEKNYVELVIDVAEGRLDLTITEKYVFNQVSQFKDNIIENIVFPEKHQVALAVRKDSPELLTAVNNAIRHSKLTRTVKRSTGDLDAIRERGYIRVLTRNHPGTYYMWKGRVMGYEYELAQAFAKKLGLRLEIIVAPSHADLLPMIQNGQADIAAALLSATKSRDDSGMDFSKPYMEERVVVVGEDNDSIDSLEELAGRTIYVRKSSNHYEAAMDLKKKVPDVNIELAPDELNIQEVIDRVADGDYDLAISDGISVKLEHSWRTNVEALIDLGIEGNTYGWMVRESNPELLKAINAFFKKKSTQKKMRILYTKYFDAPKRTRPEIDELSKDGTISPFDKYVKKYADEYDFDWRLIVAQMFQESTFNPKAKSWVGARGLMQVMPDTGKQVGEKNLFDPESSVRAGLKYLEWLHRKFEDKGISPENMMWFTLASYNAGLGHVYDAQDLAEQKGWDRRIWFDNVENAMLLLSDKKYYEKARYGYARGQEPFDYVRKIKERFRTYVALLEDYERRNTTDTGYLLDFVHPEFNRQFIWTSRHSVDLANTAQ